MKYFLIILLILGISNQLVSQSTIPSNPNALNEEQMAEGWWTIWFDSQWNETSNIDSVMYYRIVKYHNDQPVGTFRDYYRNGKLQFEGKMISDHPKIYDSVCTWYYANGKKSTIEKYDKGKLLSQIIFDMQGKITNFMDGIHTLVYENGDKYVGSWKDGLFYGYGTLYYNDSTVYKGYWKQHQTVGEGVLKYPDGTVYKGSWVSNGTGKVTIEYPNGDRYEGFMKDYLKDSLGKFFFTTGDVYDGHWLNDKRSGQGMYYFPNKEIYIGEWEEDKITGFGVYFYPDGRKYEGHFYDSQFEGEGKFLFPMGYKVAGDNQFEDGISRRGIWENGYCNNCDASSVGDTTFSGQSIFDFIIEKFKSKTNLNVKSMSLDSTHHTMPLLVYGFVIGLIILFTLAGINFQNNALNRVIAMLIILWGSLGVLGGIYFIAKVFLKQFFMP